jgi:hypothetical protein
MKILLAQGGNALAALPLKIIANLTLADCAPTHIAAEEEAWHYAITEKRYGAGPGTRAPVAEVAISGNRWLMCASALFAIHIAAIFSLS